MKVFIVACVLFSVAFAQEQVNEPSTFLKECFDKDSISCVQMTVRPQQFVYLFLNWIHFFFLAVALELRLSLHFRLGFYHFLNENEMEFLQSEWFFFSLPQLNELLWIITHCLQPDTFIWITSENILNNIFAEMSSRGRERESTWCAINWKQELTKRKEWKRKREFYSPQSVTQFTGMCSMNRSVSACAMGQSNN